MQNASKDENFVSSLLATLSTDGKTVVPIQVLPTTHELNVADGTTGSDHGPSNALRDANNVPVFMAVSSHDGVTPVAIYADSNGNLLIDSL